MINRPPKTRLARTILALIPAAFILTGCAQSLEGGRGGGEEFLLSSDLWRNANLSRSCPRLAAQTEENEFDIIMTSACGAGDVFGCGLLFASRALLSLLRFFEILVTSGLIALGLPFLIGISLREAKKKQSRKTKRIAGGAFGAMPEGATPPGRQG